MDLVDTVGVRWKLLYVFCVMFFCVHTQALVARQEFQNKFIHAKQQLTSIYQHSTDKSHINLGLTLRWTQSLDDLYPRADAPRGSLRFMWGHNKTLLSMGLDIWALEPGALNKIASLPPDYPHDIRFVKSVQWQERWFLLTCLHNKCSLLTAYPGYKFTYCQHISDIPGVPVAAEFFSQGEDLFLVVLFQADHSMISQTTLYRWQKTYMDRQLIPEITTTASTVIVFGYKDSTIFILGCTSDDRIKFPSQVWRRELNGDVRKVQYLPTWKLLSLTHFVERGENFLIALEEKKATIYWWEGDEFVRWLPVEKTLTYFSVSISRFPISPTLLTFSHDNALKIYVMTSDNLEKVFEKTFTDMILIISTTIYYEADKIYMIIHYKSQDGIYIKLHEINKLSYTVPEEPAIKQSPRSKAQEALDSASNGVSALNVQLGQLDSILKTLLLTNREIIMNSTVTIISEAVEVRGGAIWNLTNNQPSIGRSMQDLHSKIFPLQKEINLNSNHLRSTPRDTNKHLVIMGNVHLHQAKINSLVSNIVNDGQFEPLALLKKNSTQRLSNVKAKNLTVNWLVLEQIGKKPVKDLLLDDWKVKVPVNTSLLSSRNLQISNDSMVNNVMVKDLMEKQVAVFTGEDALYTTPQILSDREEEQGNLQLQDFTVIENLNVETINTIPINNLMTSVFVKHKVNKVNGNLHFKNGLRINKLVVKNIIQPPVRYEQFPVQNKPYGPPNIYYPPKLNAAMPNGTQMNPHMYYMYPNPVIRRTRREYSGKKEKPTRKINAKVKIIGNLRVRRLIFQNSSLLINNQSLPTSNIDAVFWTYNSPQVILNPITFSQGVSLSRGLDNPIVNDMNLTHYATRKSNFRRLTLENIHIDGDFVLKDKSSLRQNKSNTGSFQGFKLLEVKHLHTDYINDRHLQNIVQLNHLLLGQLNIVSTNVSVKGDLEADMINDIDVKKKFQSTIFIDEDSNLPNIVFGDVSARQVELEILNGFPAGLLVGLTSLQENSSVHIRGDLHVAKLSDVVLVNNKTANLSLVVNRSKENDINGKKHFMGQVASINHITVTNINGMKSEHMFESLLRTSEDQLITGFFTIETANIDSLSGVKEINGVEISRLIYTDRPQMSIYGDIHFKNILIEGNIVASSFLDHCILPKVEHNTLFVSSGKWSNMSVEADCGWELPAGGRLQHLLDSAVTVDSSQTISGNVVISHLFSKSIQAHSLNDKNITFIFQDSFYRNKKDQVFTGKKSFLGSIMCETINVKGDARFTSVNDVNINDIDRKLIRHKEDDDATSRPVSGHKRFMYGFKSFVLTCPEGINGIPASSLAQDSKHEILPPMIVRFLTVSQNIQVERINGLLINQFIKDCVYSGDDNTQFIIGGLHIKGNVILQGNITTPSINNISSSDLVYTKTGKRQLLIKGCQTFMSNIIIETNSSVETLNGRNLSTRYQETLKVYENTTINGSLVIFSEVELDTIYAQEYLVGQQKLVNLKKTTVP